MFNIRNLSTLAYARGFSLWLYCTGKAPIVITLQPGFFNDVCDMMNVGDRIMVSGANGAIDLHVQSARGAVDVVPLLSTDATLLSRAA